MLQAASPSKPRECSAVLEMRPSDSWFEEQDSTGDTPGILQSLDDLFTLSLQVSDVIFSSESEPDISQDLICSASCLFVKIDTAQDNGPSKFAVVT